MLALGRAEAVGIALTRLRSAAPHERRTIIPPRERAYSLQLHLRNSPDHELWLGGRRAFQGGYEAGATSIVDLDQEPAARIGNAYDILQIYVPRTSIEDVAAELGAPPVRDLTWRRGAKDPIAAGFAALLLPVLEDRRSDALFVDHALLALRIHIAQTYGGVEVSRSRAAGGLAGWQERRAKEIMQVHFAGVLSIADLARECGLSPSHFTRAFRQSTGVQPHRWLCGIRLDSAKRLLRAGDLPLAEIALACGFGDQSYFTRIFTREVGLSPGAWQRRCRD